MKKELDKKYLKIRIYCSEILNYYNRGEYSLVDKRIERLKSSIEQNIISI